MPEAVGGDEGVDQLGSGKKGIFHDGHYRGRGAVKSRFCKEGAATRED